MSQSVQKPHNNTEINKRSLNCGGRLLDLGIPQIMAILNITPDSFFDGGQLHVDGKPSLDKIFFKVESMLAQGAAIIDVGGESTRPGADPVSLETEAERVLPVVEGIRDRFDTIISVDSSSPEIMLAAADRGAGLLNDVRALERDGALKAAAKTGLPVCLMHMQGRPDTMQSEPDYTDVVSDVGDYLIGRAEACESAGIDRSKIVLDPGFGFGKTPQHNLQLLHYLEQFTQLGFPLLVGLSRKSLIGAVLGKDVPARLAGSLALAMLAAERGASILRVHDVAETNDALRLFSAVKSAF